MSDKPKVPMTRQSWSIIILMIVIAAGVIIDNTAVVLIHDQHREDQHVATRTDVKQHITKEDNKLGEIVLDTFKKNIGERKTEHFNQSQMDAQLLNNTYRIIDLLENSTCCK